MTEPPDVAERERRELASAVKRLRAAVMSDPTKADELADALVRLTGRRMLAWAFAEAATEAPESVVLAARILAQRGAAGPYTSIPDAVRYFSATAQLAAVQAELGQAEGAGRTLDSLDGWHRQLGRLPLVDHLPAESVVWALLARARALLATDAAAANAHADAAALRLYSAGLDAEPSAAYLAAAVHLLLADCRWAAGQPEAALAHHRLAIARHASVLPRRAGRPAAVQVALAPVPALHETYAARLAARGDAAGGIAVRRAQIGLLEQLREQLRERLPEPSDGREHLAVARCGLAHALAMAGRRVEADAERALADELARRSGVVLTEPPPTSQPGTRAAWEPLTPAEAWSPQAADSAASRLQADQQSAVFAGAAAQAEAERDETRLRAEAEAAEHRRTAERLAAEQVAAAQAAATAAAAAEKERQAAQQAAEQAALRRAAEAETARAAAEERRREREQAHGSTIGMDPGAAATAEAELRVAREAVRAAGDDLSGSAVAWEQVARLLRPLARLAPSDRGPELLEALEALVGLRWRLGDLDGSREASREAKALAAELRS